MFPSGLQNIDIVNTYGYFFQASQAGKKYREHSRILIPSEFQAMDIVSTSEYRNSMEKKRIGLIAEQPAKWNGRGLIARARSFGTLCE